MLNEMRRVGNVVIRERRRVRAPAACCCDAGMWFSLSMSRRSLGRAARMVAGRGRGSGAITGGSSAAGAGEPLIGVVSMGVSAGKGILARSRGTAGTKGSSSPKKLGERLCFGRNLGAALSFGEITAGFGGDAFSEEAAAALAAAVFVALRVRGEPDWARGGGDLAAVPFSTLVVTPVRARFDLRWRAFSSSSEDACASVSPTRASAEATVATLLREAEPA